MFPRGATLKAGMAGVILVTGQTAFAKDTGPAGREAAEQLLLSDFDLADGVTRAPEIDGRTGHAYRPDRQDGLPQARFAASKALVKRIRPRWRYHPRDEGPLIEIATLGAGMKNSPRLAHFGVGWTF